MEKEIKINPPYIAVKKIGVLLDKVTSRSYDKIDRQVLMGSYNFSDGESSQAVGTLTFLGIVNSDKSVNKELVASIGARNEEKKAEGIKTMVENAYKELFDAFPGVATSDNDDIHDEMKRVYDLSPRIANTAVPAFVYLCELAGLRKKVDSQNTSSNKPKTTRPTNQTKKPAPTSKVQSPTTTSPDGIVIDFADGDIKLVLPQKVMTSPDLLDDYKTLVSAVNTFVVKYKSTTTPPTISTNDE